MGLFSWAEDKFKTFTVWDVAVFKIYLFGAGMIVGAYVAGFVKEYILYFGIVVVLSLLYMLYKMIK